MTKKHTAIRSGLKFVALGGLGEIGMNCQVLESDGRLLVIDCGVMFSPENLGIDQIHPEFHYLAERRDDIEAVVLTHAHEDHIAGVPYLLKELEAPVYGGAYALGLLEERQGEFDSGRKLVGQTVRPGETIELGPFRVHPFPMPHSVVENTGLVIDTPDGRVLHTGDFKIGLRGPDQGRDVLERLAEEAGGGIDLMLSDSTGAEEGNPAGDEARVEETIEQLTRETPGRVYVAIFSSNIERLNALLRVARRCERQVTLCGRSVYTHVRVATKTGHLTVPDGLLVPLEKVDHLPRHRSLVIVSGTQGEDRSALGRLATENHRQLHVEDNDQVIFSSRFIPGNEVAIGRVIDRLHRLGARVVHRGVNEGVHVSGHGSSQEIEAAIKVVNPTCFVPIHGTYRHLIAGAELARSAGVPEVAVACNGDRVSLKAGVPKVERGAVETSKVYIHNGTSVPESALKDRRILAANGVLIVSFAVDSDGGIVGEIEVIARGVVYDEMMPWLTEEIAGETRRVIEGLSGDVRCDRERQHQLLRSVLRKFLNKRISREPYVLVAIVPISTEQ